MKRSFLSCLMLCTLCACIQQPVEALLKHNAEKERTRRSAENAPLRKAFAQAEKSGIVRREKSPAVQWADKNNRQHALQKSLRLNSSYPQALKKICGSWIIDIESCKALNRPHMSEAEYAQLLNGLETNPFRLTITENGFISKGHILPQAELLTPLTNDKIRTHERKDRYRIVKADTDTITIELLPRDPRGQRLRTLKFTDGKMHLQMDRVYVFQRPQADQEKPETAKSR